MEKIQPTPKKPERKVISVSVSPEVLKEIDAEAERVQMTRSALINALWHSYREYLTEEAEAALDPPGECVPYEIPADRPTLLARLAEEIEKRKQVPKPKPEPPQPKSLDDLFGGCDQ